ncbi:MAG: NAD-dependent epimerase/dehydratase family protein, partial [Acetobacteraceae bacterium]|nr:NAD-dependent epimerase/dehydratase family protein [Acetobacteraceae bacterium]
MKFLVTGSAGFIGFHLCRRLLQDGHQVTGLDAMVPYYDVRLKEARHAALAGHAAFRPQLLDLVDAGALRAAVEAEAPEAVLHLAAQAGVRHALEHPESYVRNNIVATHNLLEACRGRPVRHLLLASTSSVYGANASMPFRETDATATPLNIYAASKLATEQLGHAHAHLWKQPVTAFRFFTVYGPWGRPDMAPWRFTEAVLRGEPIAVHNHGRMERDFTYVDDLVEAVVRLVGTPPEAGRRVAGCDSVSPAAPFRAVNIGNARPVPLLDFIAEIERATGRRAKRELRDMHPGEAVKTWADTSLLQALTGYRPSTPI